MMIKFTFNEKFIESFIQNGGFEMMMMIIEMHEKVFVLFVVFKII